MLEQWGIDAVLLDLQMPEMSGHQAAQHLRQRCSAASLPITRPT